MHYFHAASLCTSSLKNSKGRCRRWRTDLPIFWGALFFSMFLHKIHPTVPTFPEPFPGTLCLVLPVHGRLVSITVLSSCVLLQVWAEADSSIAHAWAPSTSLLIMIVYWWCHLQNSAATLLCISFEQVLQLWLCVIIIVTDTLHAFYKDVATPKRLDLL